MIQMTFDRYDELLEKFDGAEPLIKSITDEDVSRMEAAPEEYIDFAIFLAETLESEEYLKKVNDFLRKHLELVE